MPKKLPWDIDNHLESINNISSNEPRVEKANGDLIELLHFAISATLVMKCMKFLGIFKQVSMTYILIVDHQMYNTT